MHVVALLHQLDERQEQRALQACHTTAEADVTQAAGSHLSRSVCVCVGLARAIEVKVLRRAVAGGDNDRAPLQHAREEALHQHGVRHIRHLTVTRGTSTRSKPGPLEKVYATPSSVDSTEGLK